VNIYIGIPYYEVTEEVTISIEKTKISRKTLRITGNIIKRKKEKEF
jgi:hypothetical protein